LAAIYLRLFLNSEQKRHEIAKNIEFWRQGKSELYLEEKLDVSEEKVVDKKGLKS